MGRQERIRLAEDGISMRGAEGSSKICQRRGAGRQARTALAIWWYRAPTSGGPQSYKKRQGEGQRPPAGGTVWVVGRCGRSALVKRRWPRHDGGRGYSSTERRREHEVDGGGWAQWRCSLPRFGRAAGRRGGWVCAGRVGEGVGSGRRGQTFPERGQFGETRGGTAAGLQAHQRAVQAAVPPRTNNTGGRARADAFFVKRGGS